MAAYRFCRSDDIALLTDALNRCWSPQFPDQPVMTPATFKQSIKNRQVWSSSCMVAFTGADPIGVLIGAKRPSGTLVDKIAVHPDHQRQGHGHHLLASLGSKLAILGPPRIVAEVPETLTAACALFRVSGYVQEALLTDYVLPEDTCATSGQTGGRFLIPVTVDDLAANGLFAESGPHTCWKRSVETLTARKDQIAGLAVASDERIEAYLLYVTCGRGQDNDAEARPEAGAPDVEIVALRSLVEDGGDRVKQLLSRLAAQRVGMLRFPKVHPQEMSRESATALGFRADGEHRLYAARARSDQGSPREAVST